MVRCSPSVPARDCAEALLAAPGPGCRGRETAAQPGHPDSRPSGAAREPGAAPNRGPATSDGIRNETMRNTLTALLLAALLAAQASAKQPNIIVILADDKD